MQCVSKDTVSFGTSCGLSGCCSWVYSGPSGPNSSTGVFGVPVLDADSAFCLGSGVFGRSGLGSGTISSSESLALDFFLFFEPFLRPLGGFKVSPAFPFRDLGSGVAWREALLVSESSLV